MINLGKLEHGSALTRLMTPPNLGRRLFSLIFLLLIPACMPGLPSAPPPSSEPPAVQTAAASPTAAAPRPTPTVTPTTEPVSHLEVRPEELNGVEIHFWHPWDEAAAALRQSVDAFNASNEWGIRVIVTAVPGPDVLAERMMDALQSGTPPDLAAAFPHQVFEWGERRAPADLHRFLRDPIWGLTPAEQEDFFPAFQASASSQNSVQLPFLQSAQVLLYNLSWARELGFGSPPAAPQQFADQACAAADANRRDDDPQNDGTGGLIVSPHPSSALSWIASFGAGTASEPDSGGSPYRFNQPEVQKAFTFLRELYDGGCVLPLESATTEAEFAGRRGLFATASLIDLAHVGEAIRQTGRGDEWTVIPYPSPNATPAVSVYGPSLAIFAESEPNRLAAWLLTRHLLAPENHAPLVNALGALPVRKSEIPLLEETAARLPQWSAAVGLLSSAVAEPEYGSWGTVRWALGDAFTQLFRSYFSVEQIPTMLNYLDRTAAELHGGPPAAPLATPRATATP